MISSAQEFVSLRTSKKQELYSRAQHDSAPDAVWLQVINQYPHMKEWVVFNKTVPLMILETLSDDPNPKVRYAITQKRKLSLALFQKLASDPDETVRMRIARNQKTPRSVLQRLALDPDAEIAASAQGRLSELSK